MKQSKNTKRIIKPWKVTRSRYVLSDRWIKVRADDCETSDGVKISPYYVIEGNDWVDMVVVNNEGKILITEQYRHGAGKVGYEIPCGTIDPEDKTPLEAARRELLEETGYTGDFFLVGKISPNTARQTNKVFVFLVKNPVKKGKPENNPVEVIRSKFVDENKVWKMTEGGKLQQAISICSITIALRKNKVA